jgi:hypothetical protein
MKRQTQRASGAALVLLIAAITATPDAAKRGSVPSGTPTPAPTATAAAPAATYTAARVAVYFSPKGGATAAIVRELDAARQWVRVQAYGFTSPPILGA